MDSGNGEAGTDHARSVVIGDEAHRRCVREALERLDVRNLVLGIQDPSLPGAEEDDTGRGAPHSEAALNLLRFVRNLGFDGIQFGPQGETQEGSASPYEGTIFSRNTLSISLSRLVEGDDWWSGLLAPDSLAEVVARRPEGSDARSSLRLRVPRTSTPASAGVRRLRDPGHARPAPRLRGLQAPDTPSGSNATRSTMPCAASTEALLGSPGADRARPSTPASGIHVQGGWRLQDAARGAAFEVRGRDGVLPLRTVPRPRPAPLLPGRGPPARPSPLRRPPGRALATGRLELRCALPAGLP